MSAGDETNRTTLTVRSPTSRRRRRGRARPPAAVAKLCGADVELGNFVLGLQRRDGSGSEAARALLREIPGVPHIRGQQWGYSTDHTPYVVAVPQAQVQNAQDWGRRFLSTNGGCIYIDLDHLEVCIPEVVSAFDHVAAWHAMLRIARRAQVAANARLPVGQKIQVHVNNSDGQSNSYGSHLNFLITRRAWENIFNRKPHHQLYLATFQVASLVITGQGKVGSENGAPAVNYQLSQRADFFEVLAGVQTTHNRPLVNSRDEALCGTASTQRPPSNMARLHCIFFDSTLCHVASLLKVGMMQIVLAMIEAGQVNPHLLLDDPLGAVVRFSHDVSLQERAPLVDGSRCSAVEIQLLFLEEARRFAAAGGLDGIVPRAQEILELWEDTLLKLKAGDLEALAPRLDWVLKLHTLQRAMQRSELDWQSAQVKHLDHLYSSLDPSEGLYWAYEESGVVERLVSEERIEHFVHNPPEDTRAWTRAMFLRVLGSQRVHAVDWDSITLIDRGADGWPRYRRFEMANPLSLTRQEMESRLSTATLPGGPDEPQAEEVRPEMTIADDEPTTVH